jgi:CubicO group peptidase (beta-lactamase class C family)
MLSIPTSIPVADIEMKIVRLLLAIFAIRIGIRRMVLEADPYGNMFFTGNNYTTARNWARLGLLYVQDGVWSGERIFPEGFVDFVRSPAPAWTQPIYGGLFWLNVIG